MSEAAPTTTAAQDRRQGTTISFRHGLPELVFSLVFGSGFGYIFFLGVFHAPMVSVWFWLYLLLLLFFGSIAIMQVRWLFDRREIFRIDPIGVYDKRVVDRVVPWADILWARERRYGPLGPTMFVFKLSEPMGDYVDSTLWRFWLRINGYFGADIWVVPFGLTISKRRIRAVLQWYLGSRFS